MRLVKKLKLQIKANHNLYTLLRNLNGLKKGFLSLLQGKTGSIDHIKSTISLIQKDSKIIGKPINVTIEPTNVCNLQCPVCETGADILERKKAFLSLENFKIIIDKIYPHTNTLMYYFMGEPFLNKEWVQQVKYAKDRGIPFISTCTNGDLAKAQDIIDSKIDWVSFQIGGMTQETHQTYRVGSNLEKVIQNLKDIIALKKELNITNLTIEAGFILMKHNEHEVDEFIQFCKVIGVDSFNIIDPCVRTVEQGNQFLPTNKDNWIYDPKKFAEGKLQRRTIPKNDCPWIYYTMIIMANGDVSPCCHDPCGKETMGNLILQGLEEIWNGEKYQNFRTKINHDQKNIDICKLCSGYGITDIK